jgi:hypothetical protein
MAVTKSAGRVSIRVIPDTVGFKNDLQKSLERIERTMRAKIQAELYLDRASLAVLKRQIESLVVKIKPSIDLNVTPEEIAELKAKIERMRPNVRIDLDTALASRRIAALSRTRNLDIIARIRDNDIVQNFGKKLAGLAGLNIIGDMFREGIEFFQNIDRNAAKLAGIFTKMGAIVALSVNLASNIVSLTSQLASMVGIATLAPAFLAGVGISVGILAAALSDMDVVLADLKPAFAAFQDSISADFWREAAKPIRDVVNTLLPLIHTTSGTTNTARSLGQFVGELANSLKDLLTADKLNTMFDRMNRSIDILRNAVRPLTNAFINLGLHGSKYFERFSEWIVKLSKQFDQFITDASNDGRLEKWTEDAIQAFKDLGNTVVGVVRVFNAINKAAQAAGAIDFGDVGVALNHAADVMNSPRFQKTMTTIFEGAKKAVDGVLDGIKKLGPALETASPTINRVFGLIGEIASRAGGMIAGILGNAEFLSGMERFFTGISNGLKNLEPSVQPFAKSLGGILDLMGKIIEAVTQVVNAITVQLGPVLDEIGKEFGKLVDPLKDSLLNFVTQVKPVLETFKDSVVKPLVALIKDELLPMVDKIVTFLGPSFQVVLKQFGDFLEKDLKPVLTWINDKLDSINGKGEGFAKWLNDTMTTIGSIGSMEFFQKLMPGFKGNWLGANGEDGAANFKNDWDNFWRPIEDWVVNVAMPALETWLLEQLKKFETWTQEVFAPTIKAIWDTMWKTVWLLLTGQMPTEGKVAQDKFFEDIKTNLRNGYEALKIWVQEWIKSWNPFQPIIDYLKDPFGNKGSGGAPRFGDAGGGGKFGPSQTLSSNFFSPEKEKTFMGTIVDAITAGAGGLGPSLGTVIGTIGGIVNPAWSGFFNGLKTTNDVAWPGMSSTAQTSLGIMGSGIDTFVTNSGAKFTGFLGGAKTDNQSAWQDMQTTTSEKTSGMASDLLRFITGNAPEWTAFWTGASKDVAGNWGTMKGENNSSLGQVALDILTGLTVASRMADVGWTIIKAITKGALAQMTLDVKAGVASVAAEVGQLGFAAANAIGDLSGTLYWSGVALVSGFASGIRASKYNAAAAAAEVAQAVADQMPHSPAKHGPLSGRGYTTYSGRALVKDFAGGMMDNMNLVRDATTAVSSAVRLGSNMDLTTDLNKDGVVIDRREVNLTVYHPVAEPTSRTIEQAAQTLRMAKAI